MIWPFIFMAIPLWANLLSQAPTPVEMNTVELMCGRFEIEEPFPVKGTAATSELKDRPIRKAGVSLYRSSKDSLCCQSAELVGQTVTGRNGSFAFKNALAGQYWIVIQADGKEYKLLLTYAPNNKGKVGNRCSEFLYQVREGKLERVRIVQVD